MAVIDAFAVSRSFPDGDHDRAVVRSVDLSLEPGETAVLLGPSGSGKSTLLHLLAGLDRPTSGSVHFDGSPLDELGEVALARLRATEMGFVLQRDNLVPVLTLAENVALPLMLGGVRRRAALATAHDWLGRVEAGHRAEAFPPEVSGGEAQRAAVARACAAAPRVIFADEPTGSLDGRTGRAVMELIRSLVDEVGTTLVFVTHDERLCRPQDRRFRFHDGRVVDA